MKKSTHCRTAVTSNTSSIFYSVLFVDRSSDSVLFDGSSDNSRDSLDVPPTLTTTTTTTFASSQTTTMTSETDSSTKSIVVKRFLYIQVIAVFLVVKKCILLFRLSLSR